MPSPIDIAVLASWQTLCASAGKSVRYRSPLGIRDELTVVKTGPRQAGNQAGQTQTAVTAAEQDFIAKAADLSIDGQAFLPVVGDTIDEVIGTELYVWLVTVPAGSDSCHYFSDPGRQLVRIHTILHQRRAAL